MSVAIAADRVHIESPAAASHPRAASPLATAATEHIHAVHIPADRCRTTSTAATATVDRPTPANANVNTAARGTANIRSIKSSHRQRHFRFYERLFNGDYTEDRTEHTPAAEVARLAPLPVVGTTGSCTSDQSATSSHAVSNVFCTYRVERTATSGDKRWFSTHRHSFFADEHHTTPASFVTRHDSRRRRHRRLAPAAELVCIRCSRSRHRRSSRTATSSRLRCRCRWWCRRECASQNGRCCCEWRECAATSAAETVRADGFPKTEKATSQTSFAIEVIVGLMKSCRFGSQCTAAVVGSVAL